MDYLLFTCTPRLSSIDCSERCFRKRKAERKCKATGGSWSWQHHHWPRGYHFGQINSSPNFPNGWQTNSSNGSSNGWQTNSCNGWQTNSCWQPNPCLQSTCSQTNSMSQIICWQFHRVFYPRFSELYLFSLSYPSSSIPRPWSHSSPHSHSHSLHVHTTQEFMPEFTHLHAGRELSPSYAHYATSSPPENVDQYHFWPVTMGGGAFPRSQTPSDTSEFHLEVKYAVLFCFH